MTKDLDVDLTDVLPDDEKPKNTTKLEEVG